MPAAIWGGVFPVNDILTMDLLPVYGGRSRRERAVPSRNSNATFCEHVSISSHHVLVVLLLVAHAPLLFNDGVFMDDWLVLKLGPEYPVDIDFLVHGAGHPVFFGYYSIANMTGTPILVMKAMAVMAILSGAISLLLVATRTGLLSRAEAMGVALIVWIYPGYQMWAGKANSVYVFSFGLFLVGTWLLVLAVDAKGARHAMLRIASVLMFFLSFALNSLMALYVFVLFGLLVAVWRALGREPGLLRRAFSTLWRCITGYPDFRAPAAVLGRPQYLVQAGGCPTPATMESMPRRSPNCAADGTRSFKWAA
jgi:hypothetical protein